MAIAVSIIVGNENESSEGVEIVCYLNCLNYLQGAETSAVTLASSLVFLAMLPELQEQVYQEQVGILGEDISKEPTPQDLDKMELLIRVIKETLRHICPVAITKEAEDDIKLGKPRKALPRACWESVTRAVGASLFNVWLCFNITHVFHRELQHSQGSNILCIYS